MKIVIITIIGYIDEKCEFYGFCLYNNGLLFCREYNIGIICDNSHLLEKDKKNKKKKERKKRFVV